MGNNFLIKNLEVLARQNKGLAEAVGDYTDTTDIIVEKARSGAMTASINGISLHSRFDPVIEAKQWVESEAVTEALSSGFSLAVFGMGLGYHIIELAKLLDRFTIIETNLVVMKAALTWLDFTNTLDNMTIITDINKLNGNIADTLLFHSPSKRLNPGLYRQVASLIYATQKLAGFKKDLVQLPEFDQVLRGLKPGKSFSTPGMASIIEARKGPLSRGEKYILLLNELSQTA